MGAWPLTGKPVLDGDNPPIYWRDIIACLDHCEPARRDRAGLEVESCPCATALAGRADK